MKIETKKIKRNIWYTINKEYNNETQVMYCGPIGLVRNILYNASSDSEILSIVKIDHESARHLCEEFLNHDFKKDK
jgi:hypothetical protein